MLPLYGHGAAAVLSAEEKLAAALSARPRRGRILWITLPAMAGNLANLLDLFPNEPLWAFETRDGVACVGLGATESIELGTLDAGRARRFADRTFARIWSPAGPMAAPRLFGGAAFSARSVGRVPWGRFPAIALTLPRWTFACEGGRATLSLALRAPVAPSAQRQLRRELAAIQKALASPLTPSMTAATRSDSHAENGWAQLVGAMLDEIRTGQFKKLVAARATRIVARDPWRVAAVFDALRLPGCTAFAVRRNRAAFLGATPERLVAVWGRQVSSEALAGTAPRGQTAHLRRSEKDLREHFAVVSVIAERLKPWCTSLDVAQHPSPRLLRDMVHLVTPIEGRLRHPAHVLNLALALHPTPAVSGVPVVSSSAWIAEHEPTARGWYAGFVGFFDARGAGEFHVAIRSGLIRGRSAWVFAGAGIVEGSQPAAEYEETEVKQRPFLRALGLQGRTMETLRLSPRGFPRVPVASRPPVSHGSGRHNWS
jgi:isochorismate synthase